MLVSVSPKTPILRRMLKLPFFFSFGDKCNLILQSLFSKMSFVFIYIFFLMDSLFLVFKEILI